MTSYKPPLKEIEFLLRDVLKAEERTKDIPSYAGVDWETSKMMLDTVADYAVKTALPLNKTGDLEGCTFNPADGSVKTPKGFKQAYDIYRETGLIGLHGSQEFGGIDMPHYLGVSLKEIITATNFSLASYAGLTAGAAKVLEHFASDEIKNEYLPKMYAGEWTGTMCLTEPEAGSDLGNVRSTATPLPDGGYSISGNKIFITCGEHDMAGNICHLVLARLPGAPEGTKGISLFLVPKTLPDTGSSNGVSCIGIEHKMGIHGSATASLNFSNAKGVLIGKPNEGLKAMFTMMNDARLNVGIQGLSLSDISFQNAYEYANIRVQGKRLQDQFNANAKAVAIIEHTNVRKELVELKARIDGFRALAYDSAIALDIAEKHPDAATREQGEDYTSLLTPVLKSGLTDLSCAAAQKGVQLHGGMGFITETGVEQFYRDAIIGTIYEGTNDIQSMDFTFRKALAPKKKKSDKPKADKPAGQKPKSPIPTSGLAGAFFRTSLGRKLIERKIGKAVDPATAGTPMSVFGLPMQAEITAAKSNPALREYAKLLEGAFNTLRATTQKLAVQAVMGKPEDVLIHARDFMDLFSKVAVGRMWLKMMSSAQEKLSVDPNAKAFCDGKMQLGDVYMKRIMLPEVASLKLRIDASVDNITKLSKDNLAP